MGYLDGVDQAKYLRGRIQGQGGWEAFLFLDHSPPHRLTLGSVDRLRRPAKQAPEHLPHLPCEPNDGYFHPLIRTHPAVCLQLLSTRPNHLHRPPSPADCSSIPSRNRRKSTFASLTSLQPYLAVFEINSLHRRKSFPA